MARLALQRGGIAIDNPLGWWDSLSDETVEFWSAYWRVEPWGTPWHRHAGLMQMLDVIYSACLGWFSGGKSRYEPQRFGRWMPTDWQDMSSEQVGEDITKQLDNLRNSVCK